MKRKILLISLIVSIFSVNSLFAGLQFHINPKFGAETGVIFNKDVKKDTLDSSIVFKKDYNFQLGYGFQIGDGSNSLKMVSLLFDFGAAPINLTYLINSKYDYKKNGILDNPSTIFLTIIPAYYTGLALNFDFENNFILGLAGGFKFGISKDLSDPILGGYARTTLGYKFFKTEKIALSAMFDIYMEGYSISEREYKVLASIDDYKDYATVAVTFGMGFQFGK